MRQILVVNCISLIFLTACNVHRTTIPPHTYRPDNSLAEIVVYRAFLKNHLEQDWKTSCSHAVLDLEPLQPENKNPTQWFYLQSAAPSQKLSELFLTVEQDRRSLAVRPGSFFIPVDNAVLKTMFSQNCSIMEMQQLKCGWLQFKQLYGSSCGHWHFSHIAFGPNHQALFRYELHVYHWFENGWALMQERNGKWNLTSVGVESIS